MEPRRCFSLIVFAALVQLSCGRPHLLGSAIKANSYSGPGTPLKYEIKHIEQQIDHFGYSDNVGTYSQRYIYADEYWGRNSTSFCKGPIFFYTGNEGDIFLFYNNTGFVTDVLAEEFGALVVFAEHRYYGESLPFGSSSFDLDKVGYLTTEQALADYAFLIRQLRQDLNANGCPIIAFGGSYGGMLSAWFRLKYPQVIDGAIAASAPILQFYGTGVSQWVFNEIASNDFGSICIPNFRAAMKEMLEMGQTTAGLEQLSNMFGICTESPLQNVQELLNWVESGLTYMAMINYPYPTNFLEPVPAWPVNVSCETFLSTLSDTSSPLLALSDAIGIYYNYTGQASCYNFNVTAGPALGTSAWDYQACTEMIMPISSNGTSDMFPLSVFNLDQQIEYCQNTWGVTPRPNWIITNFGGELNENGLPNIVGSNIVFSNGNLDPWSGGGVLDSISDSLVAVRVEQGAHHLDLRAPSPDDPPGVIQARKIEIAYINQWILEKYESDGPN